jgi:hypothetical protein
MDSQYHEDKSIPGHGAFFFGVGTIGLSKCGGRKQSTLADAARHNRRAIQAEFGAHSHIDAERIYLNETIAGPSTPDEVVSLASKLMAGAGVDVGKLRKDHTQAVEILFSLAPDTTVNTRDYFLRCVAWVGGRFGAYNILSADIHCDESAPHCHVLILPLVDGRMQGSDLIAKPKLANLRKSFASEVANVFGLMAPPGRMTGAMRGKAVCMVLERLESTRDPILNSPLWQTIKRDIERDPARFVSALGIEVRPMTQERKVRTMAQIFTSPGKGGKVEKAPKPIGLAARATTNPIGFGIPGDKPIGFERSTENALQKERTLCSVGFASPSPSKTPPPAPKPAAPQTEPATSNGQETDERNCVRDGCQPINSSTQQLSTSGNITSAASPKSGTSATFQQASSTTEVSPTECELVYASDDDGEDF